MSFINANVEPHVEVAVFFYRPWWGEGVKRFVGTDEVQVGLALGKFMIALYRRKGCAIELAMQRADGTHATMTGREWEEGAGLDVGALS